MWSQRGDGFFCYAMDPCNYSHYEKKNSSCAKNFSFRVTREIISDDTTKFYNNFPQKLFRNYASRFNLQHFLLQTFKFPRSNRIDRILCEEFTSACTVMALAVIRIKWKGKLFTMFFCSLHFSSFLSALSPKWLVGSSRARKSHLNLLKSCDSFGENHGDGNFLFSFARLFEIRNIILSFRCSWLVDWGDFSAACFFQCYHFNRKFSNELDRQEKQKIFFLFGGYIHVLNAVHAKRENTDTNERSRHKKKTRVVQRGTLWVVMNKLKASLE